MVAPFSVVIPAHNEEDVLARCLTALYDGAPPGALPEVIVAANGCRDRTVEIARKLAPQAIVLDLPAGSKVIAMNEGNRLATAFPRFFLDADVECSYRSLAAAATVLREDGVMAASPALRMDLSRCDPLVRAYYRVWLTLPYVTDRLVGSGLFGLSEEGMRVIGEFVPTFADDTWVRTRFSYEQRRNVSADADGSPVYFTVRPPRTVADQIKIEARRRIGAEQVLVMYPSEHNTKIHKRGDIVGALGKGVSPLDLGVYVAMKAIAMAKFRWNKARGKTPVWVRDVNARKAG